MKRWIAWLLALMLLLPAAALAVSYPVQRGAVNDDAGVLSEQTAADIGQLNTAARSADISFVVATRHFLGGADAQAYCDGLFEAWKLDQKTVLVLLVIGEERYAVAVGQGAAQRFGGQYQQFTGGKGDVAGLRAQHKASAALSHQVQGGTIIAFRGDGGAGAH